MPMAGINHNHDGLGLTALTSMDADAVPQEQMLDVSPVNMEYAAIELNRHAVFFWVNS